MNRYKGLYEKKNTSSSWHKRRFYDFQTQIFPTASETELFIAKVLPVQWSLPVKFDSTVTVDTSVTAKYINFNFVTSVHNVYLMTSKAAYDDGNFTGALQVTTNKRYQIPNGGNYYFSCSSGNHCNQGLKMHVIALPLPSPPPPTPPAPPPPPPASLQVTGEVELSDIDLSTVSAQGMLEMKARLEAAIAKMANTTSDSVTVTLVSKSVSAGGRRLLATTTTVANYVIVTTNRATADVLVSNVNNVAHTKKGRGNIQSGRL
jgi:hypothetical protein